MLGRQMRTGPEGEDRRVANESGLRALGARIDSERRRPGVRRNGKPKWSVWKKTVVVLCAVIVLLGAVVGGGYGYLWYRYNQISKVHISAEVAAESGRPSRSWSSARTPGWARPRRSALPRWSPASAATSCSCGG